MTLLEIVLFLFLSAAIVGGLYCSIGLYRARYQLQNTKRIPATGNFKITLSKAAWDKGFKEGAFAFGITDSADQVIMTMTVEKSDE